MVMMLLASIVELASIGAVVPFLGAIAYPEKLLNIPGMQTLFNMLGLNADSELVIPLALCFGAVSIIAGLFRLFLAYFQTKLSHAIGADLSAEIYGRTLYQPYEVHLAQNSSEVIASVVTKSNTVVYNTLLPLLNIISSLVVLAVILGALLAIEPVLSFGAILFSTLFYTFLYIYIKSSLDRSGENINRLQGYLVKLLQEALGGIRDVILDKAHRIYISEYSRTDRSVRQSQARVAVLALAPQLALPLLGVLAMTAQRTLPLLQQSYMGLVSIRAGRASLEDALMFLERPRPITHELSKTPPLFWEQTLTFEDVGYRYGSNEPWVLRHLQLKLQKGEMLGIVGETGSGKSTVLDIMMGLLLPCEGQLVVDRARLDH
ncbi:MAG: ABC transporter ATP-binding protein, partial [Proteobacteria bacterium]|nr:ABC transporter ATP-binding protein [Pseudomonadota bacterium]